MKEIKFNGVEVKDKLLVKIVGRGEVSASKISTEGMLFETTNQLNINSHYKFQITCGDKKAILDVKVLSVLLKGTIEKNKRKFTLYQVAVEFEHLENNEKTFLDTIIEQILDDTIPVFHDGIQGAKIRVKK